MLPAGRPARPAATGAGLARSGTGPPLQDWHARLRRRVSRTRCKKKFNPVLQSTGCRFPHSVNMPSPTAGETGASTIWAHSGCGTWGAGSENLAPRVAKVRLYGASSRSCEGGLSAISSSPSASRMVIAVPLIVINLADFSSPSCRFTFGRVAPKYFPSSSCEMAS